MISFIYMVPVTTIYMVSCYTVSSIYIVYVAIISTVPKEIYLSGFLFIEKHNVKQ